MCLTYVSSCERLILKVKCYGKLKLYFNIHINQQSCVKTYFRSWEIKCMGKGKVTEFDQPAN